MKLDRLGLWLLGGFLALVGVVLGAGGIKLLMLGGSFYYVLAGLACLVAGVLIIQGRKLGATIYIAFILATILWSVWEAGLDFWRLLPRLGGPLAIALLLLTPWVQRALNAERRFAPMWQSAIAVAGVLLLGGTFIANGGVGKAPMSTASNATVDKTGNEWREFGRTAFGDRFSPSNEITPRNASKLQVAWTYRTGDIKENYPNTKAAFMFEATPIKVGETLYLCTPHNIIIALDAATGKEKWRHDPKTDDFGVAMMVCRGVTYYETTAKVADCPQRILVGTIDGRMIAVDAQTGQRCQSFGKNGEIDLREGVGQFDPGFQYATSPPQMIGDVAVIGGFVLDGVSTQMPSGVVRGYNAQTGKLEWAWDMGRTEGGPLKEGETYTQGTPNAWTPFSADPALGLVYVPTGNRTPDYYGAERTEAEDKYSTSVVALDGKTGAVRWHFQTVHHDLWDYDNGSQPVLLDAQTDAGAVPAMILPTKMGEIYLLDRRTGEPLTKVEERPAPKGDIPGERYSPTQPWSVGMPNFAKEPLFEKDMWGATPLDQMLCRIDFKSMRYEGRYTPPSTVKTLQFPGNFGVIDWGSVAVDLDRNIMVVNTSAMPQTARLVPRAEAEKRPISDLKKGHLGLSPQYNTPYAVDFAPFFSKLGLPCTSPPWGEIHGVDLKTKKVIWTTKLGSTQDHAPLGIGVPGVFNLGGAAVSKGGVTFIGATIDKNLRAFDTQTGKLLWTGRLPAGPQAGVMTYTSGQNGKQYVVIAAGGHAFMKTAPGDYVIAYALPD
jgi:quinoprotein glucose dehydrogenase/quinate dehydrogenase (quinone)